MTAANLFTDLIKLVSEESAREVESVAKDPRLSIDLKMGAVLEKFPDYWNAANVHVDRVVFRPVIESTVRLANLKAGSLEMIERALATAR